KCRKSLELAPDSAISSGVPCSPMRQCCIRGGPGGALALAVALWGGGLENLFAQTSNGVLRELYLNIGGTAVSDLTNNPSSPASPSLESIEPALEAPSDFADNY